MMINKRLIATVGESKKYIAANVSLQWVSLAANILLMGVFCRVLAGLYAGTLAPGALTRAALLVLAAVTVRIACGVGVSRMAFLSSRAVKLQLRGLLYDKLLRLGAVAAVCFGKCSEKLDRWFRSTRLYKDNLESYVAWRGMITRTKVRIMVVVTVLMSIGFIMMRAVPEGRVVLGCVWVFHVLYFLFGVKTIPGSAAGKENDPS